MRKALKLMFPQTCMTANFYAACDFPKESFAQITCRMLGAKGFPKTEKPELYKGECRKAFDMGRQK